MSNLKRSLSILGSISLVTTATSSVVSCGPKIDNDVLLLLPGENMAAASMIGVSYKQIADDFNNSETGKKSNVKVKVKWEADDAVQERMSSFQQLPDLYVSQPDKVSIFAQGPKYNRTRDMSESLGLSRDELKDKYWNTSFIQEGSIKRANSNEENVLALALNKSFDVSSVNLRLFSELATKIGVNLNIQKIENGKLETILPSDIFKYQTELIQASNLTESEQTLLSIDDLDNLQIQLKNISSFQSNDDKKDAIRQFFKSDKNVLTMSSLYSVLYGRVANNSSSWWSSIGISDKNKMFPVGIDDLCSKLYYEYGDTYSTGNIDPNSQDNFFYSLKNVDPNKYTADLTLDNNKSKSFQGMATYINKMLQISKGTRTDADPYNKWTSGLMPAKLNGKTYSSSYFSQGTMLVSSSSTAGLWGFSPAKGTSEKDNKYSKEDLMIVGNSSSTGNKYNFSSQGAGLAGFKSVGNNADEKEKVVSRFLNYLFTPSVQAELAIYAGYVPSTKEAFDMYLNYKNGNYNNLTGQWKAGMNLPTNKDDYHQIKDLIKKTPYNVSDPQITDFLTNYRFNKDSNFITTKANVMGSVVRNAVNDIMLNYIFKNINGANVDSLLDPNGNSNWNLRYYIQTSKLSDAFSDAKVKIRKD